MFQRLLMSVDRWKCASARHSHTQFKWYPDFLSKKKTSEPVRPTNGGAKEWTMCSSVLLRASTRAPAGEGVLKDDRGRRTAGRLNPSRACSRNRRGAPSPNPGPPFAARGRHRDPG